MVTQSPGILVAFEGHMGHGHQHKPCLQRDPGPRHGPWPQPKPGWQHRLLRLWYPLQWHDPQAPMWPVWPRPQVSSRSLVIEKDTDINTDHTYGRATDPDMVLNRNPGPDVTMAPGGKLALPISLLLTTLPFSDLPLSILPLSLPCPSHMDSS